MSTNSTYGGAIQYTDTGRSTGRPLDETVRHVVESAHIFKGSECATRYPKIYITYQSQESGHASSEGVSTEDQFYSTTTKNNFRYTANQKAGELISLRTIIWVPAQRIHHSKMYRLPNLAHYPRHAQHTTMHMVSWTLSCR